MMTQPEFQAGTIPEGPSSAPEAGQASWVDPAWPARLLAVLVVLAFLPVLRNEFVNWDDDLNFLENIEYRGLTPATLRWAWTTNHVGVYQPVAWMLLEAQYTMFGLDS